ncbi:ral guanine nucleotide dissociation stimulator-like [Phacochoerus africanus]|uniref:ral guanine nucleotide dissociation stimulator-like n=1 Tax=Phacochoerus africanus TaxID=41426 RepID=UPI001FDA72A1|nr:ral guanine nucleotide dissociation stimulator-like [Phacochoerus africanus]
MDRAWGWLSVSPAPALLLVPGAASDCRPLLCSSPGGNGDNSGQAGDLPGVEGPGRQELVGKLVPAFLGSGPAYLATCMGTCRALATTQQVLDLLFQREEAAA